LLHSRLRFERGRWERGRLARKRKQTKSGRDARAPSVRRRLMASSIIEPLQPFLFTPDVHVVAAALPHPVVGVLVHGGRQLESVEYPLAPGVAEVATKILQDEQGRAVF
jgi:hypothetical protein